MLRCYSSSNRWPKTQKFDLKLFEAGKKKTNLPILCQKTLKKKVQSSRRVIYQYLEKSYKILTQQANFYEILPKIQKGPYIWLFIVVWFVIVNVQKQSKYLYDVGLVEQCIVHPHAETFCQLKKMKGKSLYIDLE